MRAQGPIAPWMLLVLTTLLLGPRPTTADDGPAGAAPAGGAPAAAADDPTEAALRRLLVLEPFGRGARTLWNVDPVEAARVQGTWEPPAEGTVVTAPDGTTRAWRTVAAGPDGAFPADPAWQGGYAYASIPAEQEYVRLLGVSGPGRLFWNGEPRVGDVYGSLEARLPVLLRRGTNHLLLRLGRGAPRLRWSLPPAPLFLDAHDATLPHVLPDMLPAPAGEPERAVRPCWIGVLLMNATGQHPAELEVETVAAGAAPRVQRVVAPPPYGFRKTPLQVTLPSTVPGPTLEVEVRLRGAAAGLRLALEARAADTVHVRTFVSDLDGSVQHYAVVPARAAGDAAAPARPPGLVLSLHGASVEALSQARAYAPKPDLVIVAPTNRRPFGFDWEGWGREDAREVLAEAQRHIAHDPQRLYLTGHSMGGHGTWMIGAQSPGTFAAIAPSAGWRDVWSYGGAPPATPDDPVAALFDRAAQVSRHDLWEENLTATAVYVLHGDADDNVPVSEAREMRRRLAGFHRNFAYYEEPGAGHWWGDACVDWPPLFAFLRANRLPDPQAPRPVAFATVEPRVLEGWGGARVLAPTRPREVARVRAAPPSAQEPRVVVTTENVRLLALEAPLAVAGAPLRLDGQDLARAEGTFARGPDGVWAPAPPALARSTGFQAAFARRVTFVYGTRGTPEENAWSLDKARYDAETLWYRGNGAVEVRPDTAPTPPEGPVAAGNAVLYGTPGTNAAFQHLGDRLPLTPGPGVVEVTGRRLEGPDLVALFLVPRTGPAQHADVGVVAPTGPAGRRLADTLPFFATGVVYPDWCVLSSALPAEGRAGARAAGFYDAEGRVGADSALR